MSKTKTFRHTCTLLCAGLASSLMSPGQADDGFYLQAGAGLQHRHNAIDEAGRLTFDDGYNLNGALGYRWDRVRLELEGLYLKNSVDTVDPFLVPINEEPAGGSVGIQSVLVNAYYDLPLSDPAWSVYGGLGVGAYKIKLHDLTSPTMSFFGSVIQGESDWSPAVQFKAGVAYEVSDQASLFLGYRYFRGTDLTIDVDAAPWVDHANDPVLNNIEIGARIRF